MDSECKIFVGNVPFQCTQTEFRECFEKMKGFIKAEIVNKNDITMSRGFGFLTFDNKENAMNLIGNNKIIFKDRQLRFTEYVQNKQNNDGFEKENYFESNSENSEEDKLDLNEEKISLKQRNLLIVKNLPENFERNDLFEVFSNFGKIGRYFIMTDHETGIKKECGVVEIIDNEIYKNLLEKKTIEIDGGRKVEILKWKIKNFVNNQKNNDINKKKLFYNNQFFS